MVRAKKKHLHLVEKKYTTVCVLEGSEDGLSGCGG